MPGGLLNIIAFGNANIIVHGNPTKTFFKAVYVKHTNFGMQKFKLDYNGSRDLDPNNETIFTFNIPRHAELLMDMYFVFKIPDIWSTIIPPRILGDIWKAYHFKWIENLGTSSIKNVRILIGTQLIQEYTGEYIRCMKERDYTEDKKKMFDHMSGNVTELHHPEYFGGNRSNNYPNAFFTTEIAGQEPSIRGRSIYVPLSCWFMNDSKLALPLVCLQYSTVTIEVTMRSIRELYTINNVVSLENDIATVEESNFIRDTLLEQFYQRIQPNYTIERHNLYRFLQPPPTIELFEADYKNRVNNWNADVHLIANYAFLTSEESKVFALREQKYLIKDIKMNTYRNIVGTRKVKVETNALVCNWMWFYRRSDAWERNEWSNYTNWSTSTIPYSLDAAPKETNYTIGQSTDLSVGNVSRKIGPGRDILNDGLTKIPTNHRITPDFSLQYQRHILNTFSIIFDGKYRENELESGIFNYIEKYQSTRSSNDIGLYHYNFCLDTTNYLQPSGAINLNRFKNIEFEMTTIFPNVDPSFESLVLCDENGGVIGVTKEEPIYLYTYDMCLFEERYNVIRFISGNAGLLFAR